MAAKAKWLQDGLSSLSELRMNMLTLPGDSAALVIECNEK